jgi:hypothetical protein
MDLRRCAEIREKRFCFILVVKARERIRELIGKLRARIREGRIGWHVCYSVLKQ